jgi:serine protease AprX
MAQIEVRGPTHPERAALGETWVRTRLRAVAAVAVVGALLVAAGPAAAASAATSTIPSGVAVHSTTTIDVPAAGVGPLASYLVRTRPGQLDEVVSALGAAGVPVTRTVRIVDIAVVRASALQADAIAAAGVVAEVTPDVSVQLQGGTYDASTDANSMLNINRLLKADQAWTYGATGQGVDVAVIDSGVTPVAGLAAAGQVLNGPDLSFESQSASTRYLDTFGHGTFMAGLIAGHDDAVADPTATGTYQGVAPGARIVSVKVADSHGRTDVSQVIAAIDWVVQHAHDQGMNIRVLNLSFGTDSRQAYTVDPLAYAAEVAWRSGIVVVVSSGNKPSDQLSDPAVDPFLIAAGALETNNTITKRDDSVALFTAIGSLKRSVDLVTPGVHVQGLRVPGSYIDLRFGGTGRLGTRFFRGSGTSESAAITSGVVALVLSQRPNLTPDQVKKLLSSTGYDPTIGNPYLAEVPNAYKAAFSGWPGAATSQRFTPSTGTGSLEASRGTAHVSRQGGAALTGEVDIFGHQVDSAALATAEAAGASWAGGVWNGAAWAGTSWDGASWDGASWDGASWDGASWDGASWDGASWDGASWDGASWNGASWDGASWDGASWDGASWDGASWDGAGWDGGTWE